MIEGITALVKSLWTQTDAQALEAASVVTAADAIAVADLRVKQEESKLNGVAENIKTYRGKINGFARQIDAITNSIADLTAYVEDQLKKAALARPTDSAAADRYERTAASKSGEIAAHEATLATVTAQHKAMSEELVAQIGALNEYQDRIKVTKTANGNLRVEAAMARDSREIREGLGKGIERGEGLDEVKNLQELVRKQIDDDLAAVSVGKELHKEDDDFQQFQRDRKTEAGSSVLERIKASMATPPPAAATA